MEEKLEEAKSMIKEGKLKTEINAVLAAKHGSGLGNSVFAKLRKEVLPAPALGGAKPTSNFDALVESSEQAEKTEKKHPRKAKVKKVTRRRRVSARKGGHAAHVSAGSGGSPQAPVVRRKRRARVNSSSNENTAMILRGLVTLKVPFAFDGTHLQLPV